VDNDKFTQRMMEWLEMQVTADNYKPVEVDEQVLQSIKYEEVYIADLSHICQT
jgi:hypothetical protein